jgi:hypothetical protein
MEMVVWSVHGPSLFLELWSIGFWVAKKMARNFDSIPPSQGEIGHQLFVDKDVKRAKIVLKAMMLMGLIGITKICKDIGR